MGKVGAFFLGLFSGMVLLAGGTAIALAVVPTGTYLNAFGTQVVGDNIGKRGLFDAINHVNDYTIDDVPAIKGALDKIFTPEGMGKYVSFDYEKVKTVKLLDPKIGEQLSAAITVTATLKSLNVDLAGFAELDMFKSYREYAPTAEEIAANPAAFYYQDASGAYLRAYNDDGTKAAGYTSGTLYLANLSEVVVTDLFAGLSFQIKELTYGDLALKFLKANPADLANNTIYKLVKDTKLKDLAKLDSSAFHLVDVIARNDGNADLYNLLEDMTGVEADQITLGNLSSLDVGKAKLVKLLPYAGNESLYSILLDMTGKDNAEAITVAALKTVNINNVKLNSLITNAGGNSILAALLSRQTPVTVGSLGSEINNLSLYEVYGSECFTNNYSERIINDKYSLDPETGIYTCDMSLPNQGDSTYYISVKAGVWLLLSYTVDEADINPSNGRANAFKPTTATLSSLQNNSQSIAESIGNARIYQLISAGVLEDHGYSADVTAKTLSQALDLIP